MKVFLPAVLVSFLVALSSCSKPDTSFSGAKVLSNTNFIGGYIDTYTYNSDGNVGVVERNLGSKIVFTYSGDSILAQQVNASNIVTSATVYLLHGQQQADSSYGQLQSLNNSAKYLYDANHQLMQQKTYAYGNLTAVTDYTIGNKNIASLAYTIPASGAVTRTYYSYGSTTNTIGNQNFGKGFLGIGCLNVVASAVQLNSNGDTIGVITYKYHLDDNSNIDTMASYDRYGHIVDSMAYTY